jgi:hypothetical protein
MHSARARREQELRLLVLEGVPLRTLGKTGHWIVGSLHIYAASGRWFNEETGRRGRLNHLPMRRLIEREHRESARPGRAVKGKKEVEMPAPIIEQTLRMQALYQEYDEFMARAAVRTEAYELFMRCARAVQRKAHKT